jgi:hypothetical protein
MFRAALLFLALALAPGCKKNDTDKPAGTEPGPAPGAAPGATPNAAPNPDTGAALPKLQPRAKFKLPHERSTSDGSVQLSQDGTVLAVACKLPGYNSATYVWNLSGEPKELCEIPDGLYALSASGKRIATRGVLSATVYEVATKKPVVKLSHTCSHLYFRDDNTVVSTTRSYNFPEATKGQIVVWDLAKNADAGSFEIPDNRFDTAIPTKGGKELWLFMSNNKFEVECYAVAEKKLLRTLSPENDTDRRFTSSGIYESLAADGSAFAANVMKLRIYDGTTGKIVGGLPPDLWGSETGLAVGGNRYLARGAEKTRGKSDGDWVIYDWKQKKALAALPAGAKPLAAVSGDGKTLVSVTESGEAFVFDISSVK